MVWQKKQYASQNVNPEEYLDMSIKSIINLPNELMEKETSFDVNKYLRMKAILTEQLENLAVGANKIKLPKREYVREELTEHEESLRQTVMDYYKKVNPTGKDFALRAEDVMRFIIEGTYATNMNIRKRDLDEEVKNGEIDQEIANAQMSNLKLQLIIRAVQQQKIKSVEIDV